MSFSSNKEPICGSRLPDGSCDFKGGKDYPLILRCVPWGSGGEYRVMDTGEKVIDKTNDHLDLDELKHEVRELIKIVEEHIDYYEFEAENSEKENVISYNLRNAINRTLEFVGDE